MSTLALFLLLSLGGGVASGTSVWQRPKCFNATDLASLNLPLVAPQRDPDLAPIVVEENNWSSQLLASMVGEVILSEVLGYEVATKTNDDYVMLAYETCARGISDLNFEVWSVSEADAYDHWIVKLGQCIDTGAVGYAGSNVLAIPKYLSDAYPNDYLDVGELYGTMQSARHFDRSGTTPESMLPFRERQFVPEWCALETSPPNSQHLLNQEPYFKFQVNVTKFSPYCFELITIDPNWNRNVLPSLVRNNRLNITIPYVGIYNYFTITMSKFAAKKPVFAYSWYPTVFWSIADMVRVRFKEYTSYCYRNYTVTTSTADVNGYSSVDCDYPQDSLRKLSSLRLRQDPRLADAVVFARQFTLTDDNINKMLSTVDETLSGGQYMGSVFNSACKWMKQNVKTWSLWIQITPPAPGRVLITLSASTRTMVTAVVVVSIVIVFILQVFLFVKRYDPVVSSADHQLCQLMLTGTYFGFAGVLTLISDQTYSCLLTPWLLAMSFALVFGIMIAKTQRLWLIFGETTLVIKVITNRQIVFRVAMYVVFETAIIVAWAIAGRPVMERTALSGLNDSMQCVSANSGVFLVLLIGPNAAILAYGAYLANQCRKIPENYNESSYMAAALYTTTLFFIIIIAVQSVESNTVDARYGFMGVCITASLVLCQAIMFVPKMYGVMHKAEGESLGSTTKVVPATHAPVTKATASTTIERVTEQIVVQLKALEEVKDRDLALQRVLKWAERTGTTTTLVTMNTQTPQGPPATGASSTDP
ncbi:G-protein coupled receptors family 3 profile domain-containing protein [Plasmodiophora brassicae]